MRSKWLIVSVISFFSPVCVMAASLDVAVQQQGGRPLVNAVVWATPTFAFEQSAQDDKTAQMVQKNRQFIPHILVVQAGAQVAFPNQDDIKHHVYSFSEAKAFEFKVYKEDPPSPLAFEKTGEVELGCNIHDWMLGYIKVVDSPFFDKTDATGKVSLTDLPPGEYRISVWHPRVLNDTGGLKQLYRVEGGTALVMTLDAEMAPALGDYEKYDQTADYP